MSEINTEFGNIAKPVEKTNQKENKVLTFEGKEVVYLPDVVDINPDDAYTADGFTVINHRNEEKTSLIGEAGMTKTKEGDVTEGANFYYNGGLNSGSNTPQYFNKDSKGYNAEDSKVRRNKIYIIGDRNVNTIRNNE